MQNLSYYTSHIILNKKQEQLPLAVNNIYQAYTCLIKNIENSANFIIRNLISSYLKIPINNINGKIEYQYILKENLHNNEQLVINLANQAMSLLNNKKDKLIQNKALKLQQGITLRKSKKNKLDSNGNPKEYKIHYLSPFNQVIDKTTFYQHLNANLIANILKLKEQLNPQFKDFTTVNSQISGAAINNVINNYNNFYKAIISYYKNPALFTGKPQLPNYHSKNSRSSFSLGKDRFNAKDNIAARVITAENINDFTSIRDKSNTNQLFLDSTKINPVKIEDIEVYNKFNVMLFINNKLNKVYENEINY